MLGDTEGHLLFECAKSRYPTINNEHFELRVPQEPIEEVQLSSIPVLNIFCAVIHTSPLLNE